MKYMEEESVLNTEAVPTAIQHLYRDRLEGVYSLRDQPHNVNGTMVLRANPWVGHLIEYTDGVISDLMGTHDEPEVLPEEDIWDQRMENPYGED